MRIPESLSKSLLIPIFCTTLAACSGGGGSDSGGGDDPTPMSLSGVITKGIIKNGVVTAYEVGSDGGDIGAVGTTTTDANGQYTLELDDTYQGGVVRVEVTPGESTTMVCDVFDGCGDGIAFGDDMSLAQDSGFAMEAIVPGGEEGEVDVQITPFTHMAAARALAAEEVTPEAVEDANSEVSQIVGVDIVETPMPNIADAEELEAASSASKQYAVFGAGIAEQLDLDNGTASLNENLDALAESFEDGEFTADDEVTITEILYDVKEAAEDAANSSSGEALGNTITTVNAVVADAESKVAEDGSYDPEPNENAGDTDIAKAKDLLREASVFMQQVDGDYDATLEIDQDTINAIATDRVYWQMQIMQAVLDQTLDYIGENSTAVEQYTQSQTYADIPIATYIVLDGVIGEYTFDNYHFPVEGVVTAVAKVENDIYSITINGTLNDGIVGIDDVVMSFDLSSTDFDIEGGADITGFTTEGVAMSLSGTVSSAATELYDWETLFTINEASLEITLAEAIEVNFSGGDVAPAEVAEVIEDEYEAPISEDDIASFAIVGDVEIENQGNAFAGALELELVKVANPAGTAPLNLKKFALDGVFEGEQMTFDAAVSLTFNNASTYDVVGVAEDYDTYESSLYWSDASDDILLEGLSDTTATYLSGIIDVCVGEYQIDAEDIGYFYVTRNKGFDYTGDGVSDYDIALVCYDNLSGSRINSYIGFLPDDIREAIKPGAFAAAMDFYGLEAEELEYWWLHNYSQAPESTREYAVDNYKSVKGVAVAVPLETETYFADVSLVISVGVSLPATGDATVSMALNRDELYGGDITVVVTQGDDSFTMSIEGSQNESGEVSGEISITNADGVEITLSSDDFDADEFEGTLKVGDNTVGTVETNNGVPLVRYNDGTFESIY